MNDLINLGLEEKDGVVLVSSRIIAKELGKEHKNTLRDLFKIVESSNMSHDIMLSEYENRGKMYKEYLLTKKGFTLYMFNIQGYNEFKIKYINKFEKMEKALQKQTPIDFAEALKLAYEQQLQIQLLQIEKDNAIRTKAEIGSRREATSMATASKFSKENKKLKTYIGECEDYATILAVERIYKDGNFSWRELKRYCIAHELEVKTAPDKRFGTVKSYPAKAWLDLYEIDLSELF